jgi:predicted RNase H-like nuclease
MTKGATTCIVGFDSAWTDKAPGAVCAIIMGRDGKASFKPPFRARFNKALTFIEDERPACDTCLVAVDQPTIVPNISSCRPVDRANLSRIEGVEAWTRDAAASRSPCKPDQDKLDAVLCALIGYHWLFEPRAHSIMIGDLTAGYMITPTSANTRARLEAGAAKRGVPIDGKICKNQLGSSSAQPHSPCPSAS